MSFPTPLSSPQATTLRTSGFWQRTFVCFNPGDIVFQAEANEDITDMPFASFLWTNATIGAFTDVWAGMVVFISSTTDFQKDYKYRGRVRLAPDATTFNIDLNATSLLAGDVITVIRDADLFARIRQDTLIDSSITYHNLPPVTEGMPTTLCLYDSDDDGNVTYTPAQTGIPVASGATIASYAWSISGDGTNSISNPALQNPLLTFEAGFHYLVRLITTDSNGVANFLLIQVYAVTRTFDAPVILPAVTGNVSQDIDNGYTGSITAYGGVADLPFRTHAAVFCVEHFGDNSSTPIVTNVLMNGRLRSESITTEGSTEAGQIQQVTYPIEGITAYMQRLSVPNDIVRNVAVPDEWGEIVSPNPFRMAVYALFAYTTLLNIASFSAGDSLFAAWRVGGEPVSIDGGTTVDMLKSILDRIKAAPNYAPDGEIRCEINASYQFDRSSLVTIVDLVAADTTSLTLDIDTSRQTSQVVGYGGSWDSNIDDFVLYTANAPSIPYSDAPEPREITRELLQHDQTALEASTELEARTGNDFAFNNPKWLLTPIMVDSWRWLIATNYQRYTWTVVASYNLREIPITTETKWQCQSVNINIGVDGTFDVSPSFAEETTFTDAQSIASQLPDNLSNLNPVLPILSDDPAFPDDPLWQFPTDTPTLDEIQPIDPYSGYQGYSPFSPDGAAQAARKQGTAECRAFQVLARNPGTTNSPFVSIVAVQYTLEISGNAIISSGYIHSSNFVASQDGWESYPGGGGLDGGVYTPGSGWGGAPTQPGRGHIVYNFSSPAFITSISVTRSAILTGNLKDIEVGQWDGATVTDDQHATQDTLTEVFTVEDTWDGIFVGQFQSVDNTVPLNGYITNVTVRGTGVNPFTGEPADNITGDWFYQIQNDVAQLWGATEGGLIDGAKPAILPDYNASHSYIVPYTGTGNPVQGAFALSDYTDVQNSAFTIRLCRALA